MENGVVEKREFVPRGNLVLVRILPKDETTTAAGLVLPDAVQKEYVYGVIHAVGPGVYAECGERCPINDLRPGMIVMLRDNERDTRSGMMRARRLVPVAPSSDLHLVMEGDIHAVVRQTTAGVRPGSTADVN